MKKLFLLLSLLFLAAFTYAQTESENIPEQFDIFDFYDNPFISENDPVWFDNYEEFQNYFKDCKLSEKEIQNQYENVTDRLIAVQKEDVFYNYYLRSIDGKVFKKYTEITGFKNIKYGFTIQMKVPDISEICGYDYEITNYDNAIDMLYFADNRGGIHFMLDKTTKKLEAIVLTIES